ncbi:unnamed protein product [Macrosiphum euphorbiae]|uniref:Uncharacterized protein n=1 Tax=Macrosiphum euphorbiae TaxID=13131 RepID=A0AAV0WX16_9HEMI|nr:unnamed protein product [Macrosiphum euphorbiae]
MNDTVLVEIKIGVSIIWEDFSKCPYLRCTKEVSLHCHRLDVVLVWSQFLMCGIRLWAKKDGSRIKEETVVRVPTPTRRHRIATLIPLIIDGTDPYRNPGKSQMMEKPILVSTNTV